MEGMESIPAVERQCTPWMCRQSIKGLENSIKKVYFHGVEWTEKAGRGQVVGRTENFILTVNFLQPQYIVDADGIFLNFTFNPKLESKKFDLVN